MSSSKDALTNGQSPDRVFYATGVLLDADDFNAEQNYHRGRLARALTYLHGCGTVAGLKVVHEPAIAPGTDETYPDGREEELLVKPGIALDRLGRIIEVPRTACLRLDRWYQGQTDDDLFQAHHNGGSESGVVVDIFLRFAACERGKTPAFATGPFDALDAVTPSRLRDYYELKLILRKESNPPLPENRWPDLAAITDPAQRRRTLHEAILNAWPKGTDFSQNGSGLRELNPDDPEPPNEYVADQDTTSVFLARVVISAIKEAPRPVRTPQKTVTVDNDTRLFVYTGRALARSESL